MIIYSCEEILQEIDRLVNLNAYNEWSKEQSHKPPIKEEKKIIHSGGMDVNYEDNIFLQRLAEE